jgi:hypothetical protein
MEKNTLQTELNTVYNEITSKGNTIYYANFFCSGGAFYKTNGTKQAVYIDAEDLANIVNKFENLPLTDGHPKGKQVSDEVNLGTIKKSFFNSNGFAKHNGNEVKNDFNAYAIVEIPKEKQSRFEELVKKYAQEREEEKRKDPSRIINGLCDVSCLYVPTKYENDFVHAGETYQKISDWEPYHIGLVGAGHYNGAVIANNKSTSNEINFLNLPMTTQNPLELENQVYKNIFAKAVSAIFNSKDEDDKKDNKYKNEEQEMKKNETPDEDDKKENSADAELEKKITEIVNKILNERDEDEKKENEAQKEKEDEEKKKENKPVQNSKSFLNSQNPHFKQLNSIQNNANRNKPSAFVYEY